MANNENLKRPSPSEARELGQKGGIASGKARRAKKTMREMLEMLLIKEIENKKGEKATTQEAITVSLIKQALKGNVKAWEVIRDTIGEKPAQKQEITGANGEPLGVVKEYILPEEIKEIENHVNEVLGEP